MAQRENLTCNIDLFDERGLAKALNLLRWKEKEDRLVDKGKNTVKCGICGDILKNKSDIAAFFPGSVQAVCEKPHCYLGAVYETEKKRQP